MEVETRELGRVTVGSHQVLNLLKPILGFEEFMQYALIPAPDAPPFHWLQSLGERQLAFPVVSATELGVAYRIGPDILDVFHTGDASELDAWIIVTIPTDHSQMRANLRAPLVVHRPSQTAGQIIMREDYPIRTALVHAAAG